MPGSESEELTPEEREALAAAERRGLPFLVFRDRRGVRKIFELPESGKAISIGRGAWLDLSLSWDEQVSRVHARMERIGDDWTIVDEGLSSNGTFLNGERVEGRRRLGDGDELRCGETAISVCVPGPSDGSATVITSLPPDD